MDAAIVGAAETTYERSPSSSTAEVFADAARLALQDAGLRPADVDGLGVASFTLAPDHAVDLGWRLGLPLRWLMDDANGGASGLNMLRHAQRAVEAGDASTVLLLAGDTFRADDFRRLVDGFNSATRDHLAPLPHGGPNALFALLTQRHMRATGLERADYGRIVVAQRTWAERNPNALGRDPLTLDEYLAAPPVADPLTRLDCVPVANGADAVVVAAARSGAVAIRAFDAVYDGRSQDGDGLSTGLDAGRLWDAAAFGPDDVDLVQVYDDYPAVVLVQLRDLGFGEAREAVDAIEAGRLRVNTSGGQLSAGQAGAGGGMHGLVEAVRQLRGQAGERQVEGARRALVAGYGMVLYRHGACANAAVLERVET